MNILPTHRCFDDTVEIIEEKIMKDNMQWYTLFVVHGICIFPDGRPYAHAWVEQGDTCIFKGITEPGGETVTIEVEKESFYAYYSVTKHTRYTIDEAILLNRVNGHCGPWLPQYRALCGGRETQRPVRSTYGT